MRRYILIGLGVLVVGILGIILIFRTPSSNNKAVRKEKINLLDYIDRNGSQVQWTMQGHLVGEDQRRAVRVSVSSSTRLIEILDGYEWITERSKTYPNTQDAYDYFLHGLDRAGFTRDRKVVITDSKGVCPFGNTFLYDLSDADHHPLNTWSVTCFANLGTFAGSAFTVRQLFQAQITDYSAFVSGVNLY